MEELFELAKRGYRLWIAYENSKKLYNYATNRGNQETDSNNDDNRNDNSNNDFGNGNDFDW